MNFDMIKQAQQLRSKLDKAQKELAKTIIEAESGKGAVKVTVNGQQKILSIKISPDAMNPDKPQDLEKLIMKAINDATDKSQKMASKELKSLTGGIKIPGLM
jgi:DNA-binding YbaB/EbfC family protein